MFGKKQKEKPNILTTIEHVSKVHHQPVKDTATLASTDEKTPELPNILIDGVKRQDFSVLIEDGPLSEEDKKRFYKSSKNVMGSQKIKELMNANRLVNQEGGQRFSMKMTLLFGLALSLQIIAVLLIFI